MSDETKANPLVNFTPGNTNQGSKPDAGKILQMDPKQNPIQNVDTEKMKQELTQKIVDGVKNNKSVDQIVDDLLSTMPENSREGIKPHIRQMVEQAVSEIREQNPFDPQNVQKELQRMIMEVIEGKSTVEQAVQGLIDKIPENAEVDRDKIKNDLIGMVTNAVDAYNQQQSQQSDDEVLTNNTTSDNREQINFDDLPHELRDWLQTGNSSSPDKYVCFKENENYIIEFTTDNHIYCLTAIQPNETHERGLLRIDAINRKPNIGERFLRQTMLTQESWSVKAFHQIMIDAFSYEMLSK